MRSRTSSASNCGGAPGAASPSWCGSTWCPAARAASTGANLWAPASAAPGERVLLWSIIEARRRAYESISEDPPLSTSATGRRVLPVTATHLTLAGGRSRAIYNDVVQVHLGDLANCSPDMNGAGMLTIPGAGPRHASRLSG
jgi:hypothetical protein